MSKVLQKHIWGYDGDEGPEGWSRFFPEGNGQRQSPIDIATKSTQFDDSLGPIRFNYERCKALSIFNSGHSFQVRFDESSPAIVTGGPLKEDEFQLSQFHGHWGDSEKQHGSEHTINGRSFPSELHFVHFNKKYGTLGEAAKHPDGLAVIGVFLKTSDKKHAELQQLIDDFKQIDFDNKDVHLDFSIHPQEFIPAGESTNRYFTYPGSLTTPPLSECVIWVVMADIMDVTADQLVHFHDLHDLDHGAVITHNFRPVQPLNGRVVKAAFADFQSCEIATNAPISN